MKGFNQFNKLMRNGDKEFIAQQLDVSASLVRMVVSGNRKDHYGILDAFRILIDLRQQTERTTIEKIKKLRQRLNN